MSDKLLSPTKAYSQIASLFGEENVFLDPRDVPPVETIPSPSPSLDRALGVGGWPRGRMIQIAGKPSSGKTLLSLLTAAEWQAMDPNNCACFIDAEYTYDPDWAEQLGIDNNRMMLIKTNDAARIINGLAGISKKGGTGKIKHTDGLLDMVEKGQTIQATNANGEKVSFDLSKMGVVILDSIASLQTPTEEASEAGKQNVASLARFLKDELKKITPAVARANVVMFGLNHVKTKIGVMFGDPETTPGGAAWKHACSIMLMVAPITRKDALLLNEHEERVGHMVRAKVAKNKVAPPFKKAEYTVKYTEGVVRKENELFEAGLLENMFERPNNTTYIYNGEKFVGKQKLLNYIADNLEETELNLRELYLSRKPSEEPDPGVETEIPDGDSLF